MGTEACVGWCLLMSSDSFAMVHSANSTSLTRTVATPKFLTQSKGGKSLSSKWTMTTCSRLNKGKSGGIHPSAIWRHAVMDHLCLPRSSRWHFCVAPTTKIHFAEDSLVVTLTSGVSSGEAFQCLLSKPCARHLGCAHSGSFHDVVQAVDPSMTWMVIAKAVVKFRLFKRQ
jgi:hypothetical protein